MSDVIRGAELAWDIYRMGWVEDFDASMWALILALWY